MRSALLPLAFLVGTACAQPLPAPGGPAGYAPTPSHAVRHVDGLAVDSGRVYGARPIPYRVYYPEGVDGPLPVVVWSHGGAPGKRDPATSGPVWGRVLAGAGYASVHPAHGPLTRAEREAQCAAIGVTACETFKFNDWQRPHDLTFLLDHLAALDPAAAPWAARLDFARLGVVGHSAGSGATATLAGAVRQWEGATLRHADDRPLAFVLLSPQGRGDAGFSDGSWDGITRPVLFASGSEDGATPEARLDPFRGVSSDVAVHYWVDHPGAQHTLFELKEQACLRATRDRAACRALAEPMADAVVGFLDAHVRGDARARAWLDALDPPPASAATILRR